MFDVKGISVLYFVHLGGSKIANCDMLCFTSIDNGSIGNQGGYIRSVFFRECEKVIKKREPTHSTVAFNTNYHIFGVAENSDVLFQDHGYINYMDWETQNPHIKLGVYSNGIGSFAVRNTIQNRSLGIVQNNIEAVVPSVIINGISGSVCSNCSNFVPYAEAKSNKYICYSCRSYSKL